jgi:hypothetical protein
VPEREERCEDESGDDGDGEADAPRGGIHASPSTSRME